MLKTQHRTVYFAAFLFLAIFPSQACVYSGFRVGGINLALPGPNSEYSETGDRLRTTYFDLLVPSTNRLVAAYLPTQILTDWNGGKDFSGGLDAYAMIEVPRQAEYAECTPERFKYSLQKIEATLGKFDPSSQLGELNARLKSLGARSIELGHPQMLGSVFEKTDASGFAELATVSKGDTSFQEVNGFALLRVRNRLVFAYLYRRYESSETVFWLRKVLEAWSDAILAANAPG